MLIIGGLIALVVLLHMIGPMALLSLSILLLYFVFKKFMASNSLGGKIGWTLVGVLLLMLAISNLYAIIGLAAAYALYAIYKNWRKQDQTIETVKNDPFTNFEKEWHDLNKY